MIRSMIANCDPDTHEFSLRRNLETSGLTDILNEDDPMVSLWLDFVDPTDEELEWLAHQFNLNPAVVQDLNTRDRRPALMIYPKYLFLSLFQPHIHLNEISGIEIHCIVADRCFITVRGANARTVDDAYNRASQNPDAWSGGIAYFLYLTSQHVIDMYYPILDRISNQLNLLEENLLNGGVPQTARKSVYRIKQQLIRARQMVAPQREVLSNVIGEKRVAESGDTRDLFRHLYERLLRVYDVIDSQRELSNNVLDMMENQESKRMVEAVNRLTIFSMIFLPLTFFTGLFQLNFATFANPVKLPLDGNLMFTLVMAAMIISAGAMIVVFRRRGWL